MTIRKNVTSRNPQSPGPETRETAHRGLHLVPANTSSVSSRRRSARSLGLWTLGVTAAAAPCAWALHALLEHFHIF